MRVVLTIAMATAALGLASQRMYGQIQAGAAPVLETIHMVDQRTGWAVTDRSQQGALLHSTDGGTNWRDITPFGDSGQRIGVFQITVLSSDIAWVTPATAGTATEVFRTVDGGRSWKSATVPATSVTSISFINPREGWLIAFLAAFTGGKEFVDIYRSSDGGETWTKVAPYTGLPYGVKTSITFLNSTTGWITVLDPRNNQPYLYVTRDGGRSWREQSMPLPRGLTPLWEAWPERPKFFSAQDGMLPVLFDIRNDLGERTGKVIVLFATHDGGATWTYTTLIPVNSTQVVYQAVADIKHAWVLNGDVLRTTSDGGRRWVPLPPNPLFDIDARQLSFISPQVGWLTRRTSPFLLKTLDGGRTWTPVSHTILR